MKSKSELGSKDDNRRDRLEEKLNILLKRQDEFQKEILQMREEIHRLNQPGGSLAQPHIHTFNENSLSIDSPKPETPVLNELFSGSSSGGSKGNNVPIKSNIEKFIGENLANKIGIIITVIGVSIGVKYAIDHQLISPIVRIILGYTGGIILLGLALRLKKKYENYSSVLLSGSMAIMYFITFAAYDFYGLIPLAITYSLMILLTIFTVYAAINYNKPVIAHIGLVGSYAIPFLLGTGFDNIIFLFSYMVIINAGILVIAFKRNWKSLFISAFIITWLIYFVWFVSDYEFPVYFNSSLIFLSLCFIMFYLIFLAYKLLKNEKFDAADVIILLANSSIFFGFGFKILGDHSVGKDYPGLFAIFNAIIHLLVCILIYLKKLADRNLFYLVAGLVLVFITLAIPIQFNGRWVTLLWTGEALVLFWIGSTKNTGFYRYLAYPLMLLAFFSLIHDWAEVYDHYYYETLVVRSIPFVNINFLSSILFIVSFSFISYINYTVKFQETTKFYDLKRIFDLTIPAILIVVIYFSFRFEIAAYWNRLLSRPVEPGIDNYNLADLRRFKNIWLLNYSLLFVSGLSLFNIRITRCRTLSFVNVGLNVFYLLVFLVSGLFILSELRESYLNGRVSDGNITGNFHLLIRYITYIFSGLVVYSTFKYIQENLVKPKLTPVFELAFHLLILWVISSELIHWMDILNSKQSYKSGLSILWGVYALGLVSLGIIKRKKHLRIGAIVLFGGTLVKLLFYDIAHLKTLPKTVIFILLGALLLIISFLYNKYKHIIFNEQENMQES